LFKIRKIKRLICKIKRIFYYLPYIWKNEDWDSHHIYDLLYAKLKSIENYWTNYDGMGRYVGQEKDLKNIKIAKNLCKRLGNDNYLENATFWHDKRYDERDFEECFEDFTYDNGEVVSRWVEDNNKRREKSFIRACSHSDKMEKRDKEYLFDFLKKEIDKWWI